MPNIFFDNLHLWQKQTDIDYFSHFMKTWLVFNAWMYHSTGSEKDRENIDYVKDNSNTFKNSVISYLRGNDVPSNTFREYIGSLHVSLDRTLLKNKGEEITFSNAFIGSNPKRIENRPYRGCNYKVEFTSPNNHNHTVTITKGTTSKLNLSNTRYDLSWLEGHADFIALTEERRNIIKDCYKLVNPKLYKNLLTTDTTNFIKCSTIHLINEEETICKGLIEMLYRLRCILFHGELVPNGDSNKVYENCYFILKMLIDKLG